MQIGNQSRSVTRRERQVGTLISRGLTNTEIAEALELKPSTVKKHISNLMLKRGVSRRSQIAVMAASEGWSDGEATFDERRRSNGVSRK